MVSEKRGILKEKRKLGVKQEETSIEENDACRNKISAEGYTLVKKIRTGHEIKELTFLTHPSLTALAYTVFDSVYCLTQDCSLRRQIHANLLF